MNLTLADWAAWGTIIAAGLVTIAARASFIILPAGTKMPRILIRALKFVAAAVMPALVIPDVVFGELASGDQFNLLRILATAVALLVAWRTRRIFATLAAGMCSLWLLKWLVG